MDTEMERRRADAEAQRQQHELSRQAAERARNAAEESRVSAEHGRRAVAEEVSEIVATLTTLLNRMEAVEALRRDARKP
jgi:membrane protein involved in colicin uptake